MPRRNSTPSSNAFSYLSFLRPTFFAMVILYGVMVIPSSLRISICYDSNENNLNSPLLDAPMMNNNKNSNKPKPAATLPEPKEESEPENKEEPQIATMSKENAELLEKVKAIVANEPKHEGTIDADGIDWSDDIFERKGWNNDPIVVERYKLLFFTIPKNACTTFFQLFRRIKGVDEWLTVDQRTHDPSKNRLAYFGKLSKQRQKEILLDPTWTKAIFVRDPLERTLSAYMEKGLTASGYKPWVGGAHLKRNCCNMQRSPKFPDVDIKACHEAPLRPFNNHLTAENFPFEMFFREFVIGCPDDHWKPQHKRLAPSNYKFINFVGKFETIMEDTHRLLKQIGAFEEFGSHGWGIDKYQQTNEFTGQTLNITKSLAIFERNHANHKSGASNQWSKDLYYTDSLRRLVYEWYRKDYECELYNFTKPKLVL